MVTIVKRQGSRREHRQGYRSISFSLILLHMNTFICGLFNDISIAPFLIASNYRVINKLKRMSKEAVVA
jgi:hypothetical protein